MPDGRFLSKSIATSEQVGAVSFEADYLFTKMIPFLDREGRIKGTPKALKALVAPMRDEMTPEVIERCLAELADRRLVVWYAVDGSRYVSFPNFAKHQRGARLDREAESVLPAPDAQGAELVRPNSGAAPAKVRVSKVKSSKAKRREGSPAAPADASKAGAKKRETWITPFADLWEELYGGRMPIDPHLRPLKEAVDKLGADEALRRWEIYLSQTNAKFASASRFAATLNEWQTPGKSANGKVPLTSARVPITPENRARAEVLYALGKQYKLIGFGGSRTEYGAAMSHAIEDRRAGETFKVDCKAARMWEGITDLDERTAVTEIARRLEVAQTAATNGAGAHAEAKAS